MKNNTLVVNVAKHLPYRIEPLTGGWCAKVAYAKGDDRIFWNRSRARVERFVEERTRLNEANLWAWDDGIIKRWNYDDSPKYKTEGMKGWVVCADCGAAYGTFPDMIIPDDLWEKINPSIHKGAGILCPTCITKRLSYLGLWYVPITLFKERNE